MATIPAASSKQRTRKHDSQQQTSGGSKTRGKSKSPKSDEIAENEASQSTEEVVDQFVHIGFHASILSEHPLEASALDECWNEWQNYLADRAPVQTVADLTAADKQSPWLWGGVEPLLEEENHRRVTDWANHRKRDRDSRRVVSDVVERVDRLAKQDLTFSPDADLLGPGLECLALMELMPRLVSRLEPENWQAFTNYAIRQYEFGDTFLLEEAPVERLLRKVELPLLWRQQLPELVNPAHDLNSLRHEVEAACEALIDGEGAVPCTFHPVRFALLATLTRSLLLAERTKFKLLGKQTRLVYEWYVRESMRWLRHDRTVMLSASPTTNASIPKPFLAAAIRMSADKEDRRIGKFAFDIEDRLSVVDATKLAEASANSEWAENAVLRSGWHAKDAVLCVDYSLNQMQVELVREQSLLNGPITESLRVDGVEYPATSGWVEVCWNVDEDAVYLETEKELGSRVVVQRQWLLDRHDKCLFVADSVLSKDAGEFEYQVSYTLSDGGSFELNRETREGRLHVGRRAFHVLPLGCPEWRRESSALEMNLIDGKLTYGIKSASQRLYLPLMFDLDFSAAEKPLTWRRLTVATERQINRSDEAMAARAQIGKRQWLFYRSLAGITPRTVLGEHLNCEFFASRFRGGGASQELISVNAQDD